MSVSASEIERLEKSKRKVARTRYTEEYHLEAVEYYRKAKEIDPKKTMTDCARELGINDKTPNDWIPKHEGTGRVTQARTEEQLEIDRAKRENPVLVRVHERADLHVLDLGGHEQRTDGRAYEALPRLRGLREGRGCRDDGIHHGLEVDEVGHGPHAEDVR